MVKSISLFLILLGACTNDVVEEDMTQGFYNRFHQPREDVVDAPQGVRPAIPLVRVLGDGGALDIDQFHIGNTGNAITLIAPTAFHDMTGVPGSLWTNPSLPPIEAIVQTILQAQAKSPKDPKNLVIHINSLSTQLMVNNAALDLDLKVRVSYGVGNDRGQFIADVCQGVQFSIVATDVVIEAFYTLMSALVTARPLTIGADLGYGDYSSPTRATYTARITNLPPATSFGALVPALAREVFVTAVDTTTNLSVPCTISMLASSTNVIAQYNLAAGDAIWRPIPNGTQSITFGNPVANPNNVRIAVQYGLAL